MTDGQGFVLRDPPTCPSVSALEAATATPARSHFGHPGGCRFAEKWEASTAVVASSALTEAGREPLFLGKRTRGGQTSPVPASVSALAAPWERTQRAGAFSPVGSPAVHVSSMGRRTDDPGCFQGAASA